MDVSTKPDRAKTALLSPRTLQCAPAKNLLDVWKDPHLELSPVATFTGKVIPSLNEALKTSLISSKSYRSEVVNWDCLR
jgi:hypothetical protein